jgi:hypothetical protein
MAAGAVQFYGKDQVLDAVAKLECPAWAIFHSGNRMFTKYEGDDLAESIAIMDQAIDMLNMNSNDATYTLKFFKPKGSESIDINEKSVCNHSSFNFKTITANQREANTVGYVNHTMTINYERKIMELQQKLKEAEAAADHEPEGIGSIVMDLLRRPDDLAQLINIGRAALGMPVQNMNMNGAIGAITRLGQQEQVPTPAQPFNKTSAAQSQQEMNEDTQEELLNRLAKSVDTLEKHDKKLIPHLEKLAKLAEENPEEFQKKIDIIDLL